MWRRDGATPWLGAPCAAHPAKDPRRVNVLKLGLPKGSLEQTTTDLMKKSGWRVTTSSRSYFPNIDDPEIACSLVRAQEMSRYVELGSLDCGITGKDWTAENGSDVEVICDLIYSKTSFRPTRWVLAVPADSAIRKPEDLAGKRISTELVGFTRRYFAERNIDVSVEFSWGATEAKVAAGLCDAIVEVTETGSTIRANGLVIIADLMESNPQLIAGRKALADGFKKRKIEQLSLLLQGALRAEAQVGLKMNVPSHRVGDVIGILPSITAPTVANLYQKDWVSIEVVIAESIVRDLIPRLVQVGAEGIIEYPLNKVL
ncbi:MAG: ATP phosphoribosyltransferase [Deltaproteobacteria bacterium]|nr:ATP phosphoribosyltransferase [Deltaproteobacteria bacterium]